MPRTRHFTRTQVKRTSQRRRKRGRFKPARVCTESGCAIYTLHESGRCPKHRDSA